MKKRHAEEQIIRILQAIEGGLGIREVCRKAKVSEQSFYRWRISLAARLANGARVRH